MLRVGSPSSAVVPAIGVSCTSPAESLSSAARDLFGLVRPAHVRFDVDLDKDAEELAATAATLASDLQTKLELAAFVPDGEGRVDALVRLGAVVARIRPLLDRVLLFSKQREATSPEMAVSGALELGQFPGLPLVIGSDTKFNELNRNRPQGSVTGLVWSMNPQVHASDELSLVENLQAQAETVRTARSFAPGASLHVSPVTLRPRFNAVASTDEEFKPGGLPWNTDARQVSLFAAAWTLGSVAVLTTAGVESLTYYEMTGPRGLIETPDGSPYGQDFPAAPDTAFPVALVLAEVCSLQGSRVLQVSGFNPLRLAVLACETPVGRTLLLANLTRSEVNIEVEGLAGIGSLRRARHRQRARGDRESQRIPEIRQGTHSISWYHPCSHRTICLRPAGYPSVSPIGPRSGTGDQQAPLRGE